MAHPTDAISPALELVLTRFADMVRWVGRKHGLEESDAEDLLQEVRIRLWRARGTGEKIAGSPASYVYRTALSAAVDLIRKRRSRPEDPIDPDRRSGDHPAGVLAGPDRRLEATDLADRVARIIEGLSENRRPAVRMYLAGYDLAEIAGLMGWSEAKTRNLIYRGLADLRTRLKAQGIGPAGESHDRT